MLFKGVLLNVYFYKLIVAGVTNEKDKFNILIICINWFSELLIWGGIVDKNG